MEIPGVQPVDLAQVGADSLRGVLGEDDAVGLGHEDPGDPPAGHGVDVAVDRALLMRKECHQGTDGLGRDLGDEVSQDVLGHPGRGDRSDGVDLDVVAGALDRQDTGQPGQPGLGRAVVGLSKVAEQPGGRAGVHDAAIALFAHDAIGRLADIEGTLEVHVDHRIDHGRVHVVERLVPQDAGVVDQHVDPAEGVQGGLHDPLAAFRGRHAVAVGRRDATHGGDLLDHPVCGERRGTTAIQCGAGVVHQDAGPATSELEGMRAPEPATCPGDDGYTSVKAQIRHGHFPFRRVLAAPAAAGRAEVVGVEGRRLPRRAGSAEAGSGEAVLAEAGAGDEPTKDARTARRASFCLSSSRESWRIASSLWLQPPALCWDTTPAARSSMVSADTLSALARAAMTVIEGSASPCSIWLR